MKAITITFLFAACLTSARGGWTNEQVTIYPDGTPLPQPNYEFVAHLTGAGAFPPSTSSHQGSLSAVLVGTSFRFALPGLLFSPSTSYIVTSDGTPVADLGIPIHIPGGGSLENPVPSPDMWAFVGWRGISDDVRSDLLTGHFYINIMVNGSDSFIGGQITVVPEPSSTAMLALAAGIFAVLALMKAGGAEQAGCSEPRDRAAVPNRTPRARGR